ncbi:hypothetical protein ACS0TY_003139 [Phlomoides rotata]
MSLDYPTFGASSYLSMNSSSNMVNKIHVLLVEHNIIDHDNIMNMLRCFSYEVTSVNHASSGISVMSEEKARFDLVIANMNSPDSFGLQLLQLALRMNLIVVLTSNEDDAVRTMRALEHGAFLCVKKPITMQELGSLWQHVSREKMSQLLKQNEASKEVVRYNPQTLALGQPNHVRDENNPNKRKVWTEWTVELHTKFMKAARFLGPGSMWFPLLLLFFFFSFLTLIMISQWCYPSDILELMNVPGLTRMQVARHLQKCRNDRWVPPHQRKTVKQVYEEVIPTQPCPDKRSFGSMPLIDDDVIDQLPPNQNPDLNLQEFAAFEPTVEAPIMGYDGINQNNINGAFNMGKLGQIGQGFDMDDESIYGVAGQALTPIDAPWNDVAFGDAFGAPFVDPMMDQDFHQPELGFDYVGTWQPLLVDPEEKVATHGETDGGFQSGVNNEETNYEGRIL